ncbi:MAG: hypothetical protein UY23_C0001G0016 [Candidatus Jorgensenbacteria bacterium GW2011_GWA1_48_11]|uniref:Uncharacterized protein n=1 Tax=Candidatus Jorgensenbacteria bacterium GW2011_GWA1_48_11 TaxID=1618660 RepID=A0A0G1XAQ9_9BACT|nr:MAG: hypothetical protein UY23_C0001G0016 [Candidatus Jorgensenbacteria bacterium GW2011_GWA1_48_11]KKW11905.1 MAG: hypothetical protein UY51_C0005G0147 [Candidatus Jorgensenbacteria bacterium GW2011_GWB1_49_9]
MNFEKGENNPQEILESLKREAANLDAEKARREREEAEQEKERQKQRKTKAGERVLDFEDLRREQLRRKEAIRFLEETRSSLEAQIKEAEKIIQAHPEMAQSVGVAVTKLQEEIEKLAGLKITHFEEIEALQQKALSIIEDPAVNPELAEDLYETALLDRAMGLIHEQDGIEDLRKEVKVVYETAIFARKPEDIKDLPSLSQEANGLLGYFKNPFTNRPTTPSMMADNFISNQSKLMKLLFELEAPDISEAKRKETMEKMRDVYINLAIGNYVPDVEALPLPYPEKKEELLPRERRIAEELGELAEHFGLDKDKYGSKTRFDFYEVSKKFKALKRTEDRFATRHYEEALMDTEYVAKIQEEAREGYIKDAESKVRKSEETLDSGRKYSIQSLQRELEELPKKIEKLRRETEIRIRAIRNIVFGPEAEEWKRIDEEQKKLWQEIAAKEKTIRQLEVDVESKKREWRQTGFWASLRGRKAKLQTEIDVLEDQLEGARQEFKEMRRKDEEFWDKKHKLGGKLRQAGARDISYFDGSEDSRKKIEETLAAMAKYPDEQEILERRNIESNIESRKGYDLSRAEQELKRRKSQFGKE